MLRSWLPQLWKQLLGRKNRSTTMSLKPRGRRSPSCRVALEALEDRLVPSGTTLPGFSLSNGNLYYGTAAQRSGQGDSWPMPGPGGCYIAGAAVN
jgi:hypothetical protein